MKNKIHKYDFLVVGAGLIGSIAALALIKKKLKVLVVDKENKMAKDNRTLAVNANSIDFLKQLDIWDKLKSKPQPIEKIVIGDYINNYPLIFENKDETMGNVIFNREVHQLAKKKLKNLNVLITDKNFNSSKIIPNEKYTINKKNYVFKKVIISIGKKIISNPNHESIIFEQKHNSYVGFFKHTKDHNNTAYEFFTNKGPLAILPAPSLDKKMSTFIYSSKEKANNYNLQNLIKKKI